MSIEELRSRARSRSRKADAAPKKREFIGEPLAKRKTKVKLGRKGNSGPSKFNPETCEIILDALRRSNYRTVACGLANVSTDAFRQWLKRGQEGEPEYEEFYLAVLKAEAEAEDHLVGNIHDASEEEWRAGLEILRRKNPERWAEVQRVAGHDGGPVEIVVSYSDDIGKAADPDDLVTETE